MDYFRGIAIEHELWVGCPKPNPQASLRLFCFPYAGAGSSIFGSWVHGLPASIELNLIHLPGRDRRIKEALLEDLSSLVEALGDVLNSRLDLPFAFFGHSMGALVSFEVARLLRRRYSVQPAHLFISARQAPQLPDRHAHLYQFPDNELLETIEDLYSVLPDIVKEDPEVLKLFLTIMRADLTMIGTYKYEHELPLDVPITVYGGMQDESVSAEERRAWRDQTTGTFHERLFPGGHFFIQDSQQALLQNLIQSLY